MKKTYVKPVMESELFVANEYVTACWYVSCLGMDNTRAKERSGRTSAQLRYDDDHHTACGQLPVYFHSEPSFSAGRTVEVRYGFLDYGNFKSPEYKDADGVKHFDVVKYPVPANDPHPNASV